MANCQSSPCNISVRNDLQHGRRVSDHCLNRGAVSRVAAFMSIVHAIPLLRREVAGRVYLRKSVACCWAMGPIMQITVNREMASMQESDTLMAEEYHEYHTSHKNHTIKTLLKQAVESNKNNELSK